MHLKLVITSILSVKNHKKFKCKQIKCKKRKILDAKIKDLPIKMAFF